MGTSTIRLRSIKSSLPSLYHYVTHVIKYSRPSTAFPYFKRRKAGRGLGTRLKITCVQLFSLLYSRVPTRCWMNTMGIRNRETGVLCYMKTKKGRSLFTIVYLVVAAGIYSHRLAQLHKAGVCHSFLDQVIACEPAVMILGLTIDGRDFAQCKYINASSHVCTLWWGRSYVSVARQ